ncbi:MAG TPA: PAS domain S-box protein [Gemmatimonadales bacterium]|nr:PAS domain S-box protein [Gemmatimonadales bacterium]
MQGLQLKIFAGFGLAFLLLGAVSWASYRNVAHTVESAASVAHTHDVLASVNALNSQLAGAESAHRAFLASGDESRLRELTAAFEEAPALIAHLRALTVDNAAQQRSLDTLSALVARRLLWGQRIVDVAHTSGVVPARRVAASEEAEGEAVAIETTLRNIRGRELALLDVRTQALDLAARRTKVAILVGSAVALLLAVLAVLQGGSELAARQRAEQLLLENESRFQALQAGMQDYAILWLDPQGRVSSWSASAERLKGYRADEIVGQHVSRFYTSADVAAGKPEQLLQTALVDGRVEDERWRVRRDGSRFWANVVITALRDAQGTILGYGEITRDLTERRNAEEAVQESESRYRLLFESNPLPAWVFDVDTLRVLGVNDAAVRDYRYSREEFLALSMRDLVPPEDAADLVAAIGRGEPLAAGTRQWRHLMRDGSVIQVELTSCRLRYAGRPAELLLAWNITERLRRDDELRRYAAQLEAANAELDAFAYSVSHDLRAPLRSIDGFSLALLEDFGSSLDEAARGHLGRVRAASQRMAQLIDDLLGLSKVTRAELRRQPVDLSAVATDVAAELRERSPERPVEFAIAPGVVAQADPRLVRVLLENLLGNAWKYTRERAPARIEFGAEPNNGSTAFFVRDNGAGFDMAYAHKLFGAFQRLHAHTEFEGTGIGLATVQRIVRRHGGNVWAVGAVGQGATFSFTL